MKKLLLSLLFMVNSLNVIASNNVFDFIIKDEADYEGRTVASISFVNTENKNDFFPLYFYPGETKKLSGIKLKSIEVGYSGGHRPGNPEGSGNIKITSDENEQLKSGNYYISLQRDKYRNQFIVKILPLLSQAERKQEEVKKSAIPGGPSQETTELIQLRNDLAAANARNVQLEAALADAKKQIKLLETQLQSLRQEYEPGS